MYDIAWVKNLSECDLIMCNLLSFMRIYHYNLRYETVKQSIVLSPAEARGITKITVKLRTKEDKHFNVLYFIADEQAELFKEQLTEYYKKGAKR